MMKLAACAALMAVACCVVSGLEDSDPEGLNQEGHLFHMKQRVGKFGACLPTQELYKSYVAARNPNANHQESDNYRPDALTCAVFLRDFKTNSYVLTDIEDFIVLDACLEVVFGEEHDEGEAKQLKPFVQDKTLEDLYSNTDFVNFSRNKQQCFSDFFHSAIRTRKQFDKSRNDIWIQLYLELASCTEKNDINETLRNQDSYLAYFYKQVMSEARKCFDEEINAIQRAVRVYYDSKLVRKTMNFILPSSKAKTSGERQWPMQLVDLLTMAHNASRGVNLREVNRVINSVNRYILTRDQHNEWDTQAYKAITEHFLQSVADTASRRLIPGKFVTAIMKKVAKSRQDKKEAADPTGEQKYRDFVDNECLYFRSTDSDKRFDFVEPIVRMAEMLKYVQLFGITQEFFLEKMNIRGYEVVPMYMAVNICNILSYTRGYYPAGGNGAKHFQVTFVPDTSDMNIWPVAPYW